MSTVEAVYENGVFRPVQRIDLKEGTVVEVIVDDADSALSIPDLAFDLGIVDLSVNVDHYLYGLPKSKD